LYQHCRKEELAMAQEMNPSPKVVMERLQQALNQHDIEAFVACFAPAYQSEQPIHPDRDFRGREQVRKNWSAVFSEIPDLQADLHRITAEDETVWAEWHWHGTLADGGRFDWQGVTIFGVQENHIIWGRLYMEPVQESGPGIDATVKSMTHSSIEER
jgi:predicted SnoaL-like aldol condensation-catalyzing enzyme